MRQTRQYQMKDNQFVLQRNQKPQTKDKYYNVPKGSFHIFVQRNIATANALSQRKLMKTANNQKRDVNFDCTNDSNLIQRAQGTSTPAAKQNLVSLTSRTRIRSTKTARQAIREHIRNAKIQKEISDESKWMKQPITFEEYMMRLQFKSQKAQCKRKNENTNKNIKHDIKKHRKGDLNQSQHIQKEIIRNGGFLNRFGHQMQVKKPQRQKDQGLQQQQQGSDFSEKGTSIHQHKKKKQLPNNRLLILKQDLGLGTIGSCLPFYRIKIQSQSKQKRNDPKKIKANKFKIQHPLVQLNRQFYSQFVRPNNGNKQQILQNQEKS